MNHSPFWPLVWKEYRFGRAFWLSMAVMGLVAQAGVAWSAHQQQDRNWWLYSIALMISAGFAVGIGGTLFAAEQEERTILLLRRLPVRARELGAAKILCAIAGLAALITMLWLAARYMAGGQALAARDAQQLWDTWGLACAEGLAWGILCSLAIRRPLQAAVVAAMIVVLIGWFAVMFTPSHDFSARCFAETIPLRMTLLLLAVAVDAALLPCWLTGRLPGQWLWRKNTVASTSTTAPAWWQATKHLTWQTVHDGWISFVLLAGLGMTLWVVTPGAEFEGALPWIFVTAIAGSLVFRADQQHGPRFLAARGVSPRMIWCSRHLVWGFWLWGLTAIVLWFLLIFWVIQFFGWLSSSRVDEIPPGSYHSVSPQLVTITSSIRVWLRLPILLLAFLLPAYAAGQLVSLVTRRGLLAVTFGLLLGGFTTMWVLVMRQIGASWWWSVLPLPIGFFLATWLRLPAWLVERSGLRGWAAPAAAALVPVAALFMAVPCFRVFQIPAVTPEFSLSANPPEALGQAKESLVLYGQAWDKWMAGRGEAVEQSVRSGEGGKLTAADEQWSKPIVDLVLEASQHDADLLVLPVPERFAAAPRLEKMATLLRDFAVEQQETGHLDSALDALLATLRVEAQLHQCDSSRKAGSPATLQAIQAWGAASGQTAERNREAIERLKKWHAKIFTPNALLLPFYQEVQFAIDDLPAAAMAGIVDAKSISQLEWIMSRVPWERARAHRLLDWITYFDLAIAGATSQEFAENRSTGMIHFGAYPNHFSGPTDLRFKNSIWSFTTPLVKQAPWQHQSLAWDMVCQETDFRATLIILALEAWRAEHGSLPQELNELVGSQSGFLPVDPVDGQPFKYFAHGLPGAIPETVSQQPLADKATQQPFLLSMLNQLGGLQNPQVNQFTNARLNQFTEFGSPRPIQTDGVAGIGSFGNGTIYFIPDVQEQ
jgi:ABC-type transport system involved in multi-copper enzyme maturation permease subunit